MSAPEVLGCSVLFIALLGALTYWLGKLITPPKKEEKKPGPSEPGTKA
jgi:hypothetical protein